MRAPFDVQNCCIQIIFRELKKLPEDTIQRIAKAVNELVLRPESGTRLKGELEGL
jgi:mRNA-degrading endonuclease RelE of RelBE toxin-antitoxin system